MSGPINGGKNGILIPTLIQTSADMLDKVANLTCLYDPQWIEERDRITLPICMFYVTSIHEIGSATVSKKRVILYEPQSKGTLEELKNTTRPSVMRAIADNIVRNPRQYNLDIALPFSPVDRNMVDYAGAVTGALSILSSLLRDPAIMTNVHNYISGAIAYGLDPIESAIGIASKLPSLNGINYVNKNSLDAMFDRSHFLCMKMWTGYDYKFVVIENIDISKTPVEDDMFRASLQVSEMPVMTITRPQNALVGGKNKNWLYVANNFTQKKLSDILVWTTGTKAASKGGL